MKMIIKLALIALTTLVITSCAHLNNVRERVETVHSICVYDRCYTITCDSRGCALSPKQSEEGLPEAPQGLPEAPEGLPEAPEGLQNVEEAHTLGYPTRKHIEGVLGGFWSLSGALYTS